MEKAIEQFTDLLNILGKDVRQCNDGVIAEDSQFWRRAFVRAVFALIECLTFRMKQAALELYQSGEARFSEAELALLKEESYELNDKGVAYMQAKFIQLPKNLKFSFLVFAQANGFNFEL